MNPPRLRSHLPLLTALIVWCVLGTVATFAAAPGPAGMPAASSVTEHNPALVYGVNGLVSLGTGFLTLVVTRREYNSKVAELERRLGRIEDTTPTRLEHTSLEERVSGLEQSSRGDIADLHEKINRVDRGLATVETETRIQTKTLASIASKLGIPS